MRMLFALALWWAALGLHAQQQELRLQAGYLSGTWSDGAYAPFDYHLGGALARGAYQYESEKGLRVLLRAQTELGQLSRKGQPHLGSSFAALQAGIALQSVLWQSGGASFRAGPCFQIRGQQVAWEEDEGYNSAWTYQNTFQAGLLASAGWQAGHWSAGAEASWPFAGRVGRPGYRPGGSPDNGKGLLFNFDEAQWLGPNGFRAPEAAFQLSYTFSNGLSPGIAYRWAYTRTSNGISASKQQLGSVLLGVTLKL